MLNLKPKATPTATPTTPTPLSVRKPIGEEAAAFATAINDMVKEKAEIAVVLETTRVQLMEAEAHIKALSHYANNIKTDLDYYHRRCVELETKAQTCGKLILEILDYRSPPPTEVVDPRQPSVPQGTADKHTPDVAPPLPAMTQAEFELAMGSLVPQKDPR